MTSTGDQEQKPSRRRDTIELKVTPEELEAIIAGLLVGESAYKKMGIAGGERLAVVQDALAYLCSRRSS